MTDHITANLPARSFDETADFYGRLGFVVGFRDDDWMIMSRGGMDIEFFLYPEIISHQSAHSACVRVDDLDGLWAQWRALQLPTHGIPRLQGPPHSIDDGLRMFALIDPCGSLLRCLGS
jgi:catechol 2,3-dioxygenase-like lactoylglutathione lyase family enzyme